MRAIALTFFLALGLTAHAQYAVQKDQFKLGERLNYRIKYGWFKIGEAHISIDKKLHQVAGEPHYRVYFDLVTVGWLKIFADLDLDFESFISLKTLQPHHATRIVKNGKKSNSQYDEFIYSDDSISVKTYKKEKDQYKTTAYPRGGAFFSDALGTYFYARTKKLKKSEKTRIYIANRIFDFAMRLEANGGSADENYYKLIFPPIKEFPRNKKSYAILSKRNNIPREIKLATKDGNFYLIYED